MGGKQISSQAAVGLVKNGDALIITGFVGTHPEELSTLLEQRFLEEQEPRDLTLIYAAGQGDGKEKAMNHYSPPGMVKRVIGAHYNLSPKLGALVASNQVEGYCLPQGTILHLIRAMAGRQPGVITRTGLKTFVDPRVEGGKINAKAKEADDVVKLVEINGKEYLHYLPLPIQVAFLRATSADEDGNLSMEKEYTINEAYAVALAAKNQGGLVIAQVERIVAAGSLPPQAVRVPGCLVDHIVVAKPEFHWQNNTIAYDGSVCGEVRRVISQTEAMPLTERKIIARRGVMELRRGMVLNLGVGVPDGVAMVASEEGFADQITLTVESGPYGGIPVEGVNFGASYNPRAILEQTNMFDLYDAGILDIAYLGLAQVDAVGNVNVSKFGTRVAGCGGFINITQNAKTVVFCGTLTAGGLKVAIEDGSLKILQEGKTKKFLPQMDQITFSGEYAAENGQRVLFITERAVFELQAEGKICLVEIAPGIDLQSQVLDQIDFPVEVSAKLKQMDARIFRPELMNLTI